MKRVKLTMLMMAVIAMTLSTTSCTDTKKAGGEEQSKMDEKSSMPEMTSESVTFKDEKLKEAFQHYIHVRTALTNTDAEEAKKGGAMLVKVLTGASDYSVALVSAIVIANTSDIDVQRNSFSDLSEAMILLTKGNIASGSLYLAHCPMAKGNTGANWISSNDEIANPYFGDKMMKCGAITETLN